MKKICFFSGNIDRSGGTERVSSVIANELEKKGYIIYFLSLEYGKNPFFYLNENIKLKSLYMEGKSKDIYFFILLYRLYSFLKKYEIDFIIDIDVILSLYSIPATFFLKTEVISWEHFNYFANVGNGFQNFKRQIARFIAVKRSKYLITLTDKDRNYYLNNLDCKASIITIFNPITIEKSDLEFERELNIIIAVGRLTYQKGFDLLLLSWKNVKNKDWILKIIGSGEDELMLKQLSKKLGIQNNVQFINNVQNIEKYYREASFLVMSSRYEGFGLVLTEAKSFGLPIISFNCDCGPSDIIKNNIDGILVPQNDSLQLSNAINKLIEDKELRIKMGNLGMLDKRFELDIILKKWERLFR